MKAIIALATLALTIQSAAAATSATPPSDDSTVTGFWQQADDDGHVNAWFYFSRVHGLYEGRIVKMFAQPDKPSFDTCARCPGNQKDAPMLGLTIVKGMKRDGLHYQDGTIMDPRDGMSFGAELDLSPDGQKLSVRGYLGLPMLGQTQVWTRLPDETMAPADIPPDSVSPSSD
ncbi:MAG: DUF2147 domain-containing protein [Bradyrhizobium sp.]|nr:MAG: DUF2147 domain-containing protein [Bradyrhizobium sp.]